MESHSKNVAETKSAGGEPALEKDPDFWFEDGNIVLIAGGVEFRVYKGLLIKHSPVFRDMVSLPQPPASTASEKSSEVTVPTVELSDHPVEIRALLGGKFGGLMNLNAYHSNNEQPTFDEMYSFARMAHKYQMDGAIASVCQFLAKCYSTEFSAWQSHSQRSLFRNYSCIDNIGVVNLARLLGRPEFLPIAALECSALVSEELIGGYTRGDGVQERLNPDDLTEILASRTQHCLLNAELFGNMCDVLLHPRCNSCGQYPTPDRLLFSDMLKLPFTHDLSYSWMPFANSQCITATRRLCSICLNRIASTEQAKLRRYWEDLWAPKWIKVRHRSCGFHDQTRGGEF